MLHSLTSNYIYTHSSHSYVLYLVRADKNSSEAFEVEVSEPPYVDSNMDPGQIYTAYVAFKDKDGYLSEKSQDIRVEKPVGKYFKNFFSL